MPKAHAITKPVLRALAALVLCALAALKTTAAPEGAPAAPPPQEPPAALSPQPAPSRGPVTQLPLPRFVSLKTSKANVRRGPGLTHRIDWVFTQAGLPLRVTAEYEHWRRVEDAEGFGGWVHFTLLSGVRTALVTQEEAAFRARPAPGARVVFRAQRGVTGRILACDGTWCRLSIGSMRGWVPSHALWGMAEGEVLE